MNTKTVDFCSESDRASKYIGVYKTTAVKPSWEAKIKIDRKLVHGGSFQTQEQAAKRVNTLCKKFKLEKKNPGLLDEDDADIPKRFRAEVLFIHKIRFF